ncbi:MAG: dihydrodipicolinate synthase family protein [Bryobacteraceae bacterium]
MLRIDGIVPVIPTPFSEDEEIDWAAFGGLVEFACRSGACAFCLPAYASEFYKLSEEERRRLVVEAVRLAAGKIPVLAQVNYASAGQAARTARIFQQAGVSAIAAAVPRQFAVPESDLLRYFGRILSAIDIPLLIQDFNPGGATVSAGFVAALHKAHPHFRWVKLEEAQMGPRVRAILDATAGEVGVLEGWGGMYMLDLIPEGICGVMPGLATADILARIYALARAGEAARAHEIFAAVLPQIVFSLQNLELFHHAEKRLLAARGLLPRPVVRDLRMEPNEADSRRIDFLNARILELVRSL